MRPCFEIYEAAVKYDAAYSELQAAEAELRMKELEDGRVRAGEFWTSRIGAGIQI